MGDDIDYSALALGAAGAAGGKALSETDLLNGIVAKILSRRAARAGRPDYRVPVYAGADLNLSHGSGEAVMASRIARMLRRNGIGSYYVNTTGPLGGIRPDWHNDTVIANKVLWDKGNVINGGHVWYDDIVTINGKPERISDAIINRMVDAGVSEGVARKALASGMFDGQRPGELLDTFKTVGAGGIKDIVSGKMQLMPESEFYAKAHNGRLPYMMTGEAGMNYTTAFGGGEAAKSIGENAVPFSDAPTRNLAFDTQFQANYRSPHDKLIPGVEMHDPGFGRRSALVRKFRYGAPKWLGGTGEKKEYYNALKRLAEKASIDPGSITPRSKFMLISTGSAGANAAAKLRLAELAFAKDPNVRILVQYGKEGAEGAAKGLDLYTNNGIKEEIARINRKYPGKVIGFARDKDYALLARNVDLHGAYGGSSSMTEALANTNPTVAMTDTVLNKGNNNYGTARRGFRQVDSSSYALGRLLRKGMPDSTVVNTRDGWGKTLGEAKRKFGLDGSRAQLKARERESIQALRDAMYRSPGKFDKSVVRDANRMLREQRQRNASFIDTVKRMIVDRVNTDDLQRMNGRKSHVGKAMGRLSQALFKTPSGRRLGIPLMLAGGLGLGGATYGFNRWRGSDKVGK